MSPILGILASANYPRSTNSYESIATVTVGSGGASTVTFSSIPSTYQHLQIRAFARLNNSGVNGTGLLVYNSDTNTNNYTYHELWGSGTAVNAYGTAAPENNQLVAFTGGTALTSNFGAVVTDILDYANSNKYKTMRNFGGYDNNGSGQIRLNSGLWMNTAAITSITLTPNAGTAFVEYSQFALYGIKG